jgi:Zn-dependent protease with chaperone function/Zn-finger nucleic acid-binding protein
MPFTHIDLQRRRRRTSAVIFFLLVLYYFLGLTLLWALVHLAVHPFIHDNLAVEAARTHWLGLSATEIGAMALVALLAATGHWLAAVWGGVERLLAALSAQPPDPEDRYHREVINIIEEVRIATGGRPVRAAVIPTLAVNAFAAATREDNGVIGVTEGLLARLTRPQLEAVIGHEMAHLLNHDSIMTTVACSLFATYVQLLRVSLSAARNEHGILWWPLMALLWLLALGAKLLNTAVSREREYLADATAVHLTRNPTALAEALLKLSRAWRGGGEVEEALAPIFILNPDDTRLDQRESRLADLFSTHPPLQKRLNALLAMAHTNVAALADAVRLEETVPLQPAHHGAAEPVWWVQRGVEWDGPYSTDQLLTLTTLGLQSWVYLERDGRVTHAADHPVLADRLRLRMQERPVVTHDCPRCHYSLSFINYEGASLYQCPFCAGCWVEERRLMRILVRREVGFSDDLKARVRRLQQQSTGTLVRRASITRRDPSPALRCPNCQRLMFRSFYSYQYLVIVDRCRDCAMIWFDRDELDMLQIMVETSSVAT